MRNLYPIKFEPILKNKIWGGDKLIRVLNKRSSDNDIGESWEISDVEDDISIVSDGELKGKSLRELISIFKEDLVGDKIFKDFGERFPLLIKFIDAKEALSIQVHPEDQLARERHNSFGKTEMWYVVQADMDAKLIVGFNKDVTSDEYRGHVANKSLPRILNFEKVRKGDVYFIPSGRIHAIGAGVMLAEIQQTSDITYRVYDWDRKDKNGKRRDLHINEAIDAIDFKRKSSYKTNYSKKTNETSAIGYCPYFITNFLPIKNSLSVNNKDKDSFVIYMCVEGEVEIIYAENKSVKLRTGETVLVPALLKELVIESPSLSNLLEVYIK